jgi:hypothetical protein
MVDFSIAPSMMIKFTLTGFTTLITLLPTCHTYLTKAFDFVDHDILIKKTTILWDTGINP